MFSSIAPAHLITAVSIILTLAVVVRMVSSGLYRPYRFFFLFLAYSIFRMVLMLWPFSRKTYAEVWMTTEAAAWVFYVLVLMELYTLILSRYPGIQSLGKWIFHGSVCVSLVIAAFTLYPEVSAGGRPPDFLMLFMIAERGILSALALLTLLIIGFLTWFPVPLPRNVVLHSILFAVYFFSKAAALLIRNVMGHAASHRATTLAFIGVGWLCMLFWALLMTREGEGVEARVGHRWNADDEDRLLDQLREINSNLSRSVR